MPSSSRVPPGVRADDDPKAVAAAAFDRVAEAYAAIEVGEWPRLRRLREVLADLPDGSAVLDLGCGSAFPAGPEISRRHRLTGVDVSPRQVDLARSNVPGATFVVGDLASVDFEAGSFEAVVSFYAFDAVPRDEWAPLLARILSWLRPGGHLLFSVEDADEPGRFGTWLGVRAYFSSYELDATARLVAGQGFRVLTAEVETQAEEIRPGASAAVPYAWIRARKPG